MSATSSRARLAPGLVVALLASGCATSSIRGDVSDVRELTRVERIAQVADVDVDPAAHDEARRALDRPLDADAAVRVALLNNRELRATLREMGVARGRLVQAGLLPNPTVEGELLPEQNSHVELRVEYDVTSAVLAPVRARAAEPDLDAARYRAAGAVVALGYRVRVAWFRVAAVEQRLAIARQVLDGFAAARDAAAALHDAGNIPALDHASQEAAYQRARVSVAQLELEAATERERMQRLLGAHGDDTKWRLAGGLPKIPDKPDVPEDVEVRALRASLELVESRHRLEGLARRAGATRLAGFIPDVSVDVHALQADPARSGGLTDTRDLRFGGGLKVGVPIFDRKQGTVTALEATFDAELERFYGMAVDVRSAAREARARVLSSHARARHYQAVIGPAQRKVTEQTLLQYNAMQVGVFQLLAARKEELEVELAAIDTAREYLSARAELEALFAGRRVSPEAGAAAAAMGPAESRGGH